MTRFAALPVAIGLLSPILSSAFVPAVVNSNKIHQQQQLHDGSSLMTPYHSSSSSTTTSLGMSSVEQDVNLVLTGNNIDLTEALQEQVDKRIGGLLQKLGSGGLVRECDVHLSVYKNPKVKEGHRVEITTLLKGLTVHVKEERADMYAAIDAAAAALSSKLRKYRTRRQQGYHAGNKMSDDLSEAIAALEEEDMEDAVAEELQKQYLDEAMSRGNFIDPDSPDVMKVNSFDLKNAIPMQEAVFALDYVDHDFFVFKNEDTGKPSIVYKRNAGGVGLIEIE